MVPLKRVVGLTVLILALAGCSRGFVHKDLASANTQGPRKVLVAQPDVRLYELGLGLVPERVVAWENQAAADIVAAADKIGREENLFSAVPMPKLDAAQQKSLEQHRALFATMARTLFEMKIKKESAWSHKRDAFDYTLGPGMASLREATGADVVMFFLAEDKITSSTRKVLDAAVLVMSLGMNSPASLPSSFTIGLVDLRTGNLLWYNDGMSQIRSLNTSSGVEHAMRTVLSGFPRKDEL